MKPRYLIALIVFLLLSACGRTSNSNVVSLLVQADCRNPEFQLSAQGRVRVVLVDAKTHSEIAYIFLCDPISGLLLDPVEERRSVQP